MQAIFETIFDIAYLTFVITVGIFMIVKSKGYKMYFIFALAALVLGVGDAFHLIPRICSYWMNTKLGYSAGLTAALGFGKLVTSITMTVFYVLIYEFWKTRYSAGSKLQDIVIYSLAGLRVLLCLMPQNHWLSAEPSYAWGIYRNIPFVLLGIIIVLLFYFETKRIEERAFKYAWLAIALSFIFYILVVLWADAVPAIGMLMIPKTIVYAWLVYMGFSEFRRVVK